MQSPILLSPQRAEVLKKLKKMWERETLISNFYLFNHSHCYIDFSNLTKELLQAARTLRDAAPTETSATRAAIPNRVLEHFLQEHSAGCQTFEGLSAKLDRLDNQEGQVHFLQLLEDDRLLKKLMRSVDDRDLIFRFVKGKLQTTRRSLLPGEYKFY